MTPPRPVVRRVGGPGAEASGSITIRPAVEADLPACTQVWRAALSDYLERLGQPPVLADLEPLRRLLAHLRSTDPDRFWVACRTVGPDAGPSPDMLGAGGERIVGFASANVRGGVWFLAMLFVEPAAQARGLGRRLLERSMRESGTRTLGTATDSAQPISNALYARLGIVPRLPLLHLIGEIERPGALPALPAGIVAEPMPAVGGGGTPEVEPALASIDRTLLGYEHPQDHAWLAADGRAGILFRDGSGEPVGYGYTTGSGRIGPVAAIDRGQLAAFVATLVRRARPGAVRSLWVPGDADEVVRTLLAAGLALEPFPALLCWSRPFADFGRYVPISLALL